MLKILAASLFCLFSLGWANGQSIQRYVLDSSDVYSGVFLVAEPPHLQEIQGVLVLLGGFGQTPEHTPPETKLHLEAAKKG